MSLPGADELFRTTGGMALQASSPRRQGGQPPGPGAGPAPGADAAPGETRVPAQAGESDPAGRTAAPATPGEEHGPAAGDDSGTAPSRSRTAEGETGRDRGPVARAAAKAAKSATPAQSAPSAAARRGRRAASRRPSGRERHDEKITVYVSAEELMDLEHARLVLRGEHGLAVDRGRIVREAVAVVLADLESRGDASILVRRLRGR
ncbi:hypothetical protein BJP40_19710 [Streptomyces sp. CC53]|nr:hypothetical protein BJP40_19710 [Streptomyces sp. CC53]